MAILATRRRCEVTSLWAASESPCSRQRLASMNSSLGSSIGNLRISSRYRDRPPSLASTGSAADAILFSSIGSLKRRALGGDPPLAGRRTVPYIRFKLGQIEAARAWQSQSTPMGGFGSRLGRADRVTDRRAGLFRSRQRLEEIREIRRR